MHIVLGHDGKIVVEHVVNLGHVDAAGQHVGGHQHLQPAGAEVLQGLAALGLGAVRVDGVGGNADGSQSAGAVVGAALGLGEDDGAGGVALLDHAVEQLGLFGTIRTDDELLNFVSGLSALGNLDYLGVVQQPEHHPILAAVDGGGKQKGLAVFGGGGDNLVHLGPKAHVKHAVGLVNDQSGHIGEVNGAPLHQVNQASRGGDAHVNASLQPVDLGSVGHAAQEHAYKVAGALANGHAGVGDLAGQLAGGGDDQQEGPLLSLGPVGQGVHAG